MVKYDRTKEMIENYLLEHHKELMDANDWDTVIQEHDTYWGVNVYSSSGDFSTVITVADITSWLWFHTMKYKSK